MELNITNKVVGIPSRMGLSMNAKIQILGVVGSQGIFSPLSPSSAKKIFTPDGQIFAYNFFEHYSNLDHSAVCLHIKQKDSAYEEESYSSYVWDFTKDTTPYGDEAYIYPIGCISGDDADGNAKFAEKHKFTSGTHYAVCGNYLYRFSQKMSDASTVERWNMARDDFKTQNNEIILFVKDKYLILSDPVGKPTLIDKMSNEVLMYWLIDHILPGSYPALKPLLQAIPKYELLSSAQVLDGNSRIKLERLTRGIKLLETINYTTEQLDKLAQSPIFGDKIKSSIEAHEKEYVLKVEDKYADTFKKMKEMVDNSIAKEKEKVSQVIEVLEYQKNGLKKEIEDLEKSQKEKQAALDDLTLNYEVEQEKIKDIETRKETILGDFEIIKDVLALSRENDNKVGVVATPSVTNSNTVITPEFINTESDPVFDLSEDFRENVAVSLHHMGIAASETTLISLLAYNSVVLVPDSRLAYALIKATGRCYTMTAYVGIDWTSPKDLWDNGLSTLLHSCEKHPDVMHYLVLQNINLSYLPSYLQPLLDLVAGYTQYYPNTNVGFQENMRVICTVTPDKGIPMPENCLTNMGCYPKTGKLKNRDKDGADKIEGYLTPEILNSEDIDLVQSDYTSYLEVDEDE